MYSKTIRNSHFNWSDAVKTGMLGTEEIIKRAGEAFEQSGAKYFVVDPVMVCKGKTKYLTQEIQMQ